MPNDFNVSLDLSGLVVDLYDRFMGLFGRDRLSADAQAALQRQLKVAARHAAVVQIVGMDRPVSIYRIYQPTRLRDSRREQEYEFLHILRQNASAVILGGPGRGKTVLMHYLFATLIHRSEYFPLLFTLRWPGAVSDLLLFMENLGRRRLRVKDDQTVVLLVDGYDEVSIADRRLVDKALREFAVLNLGPFYLTCRQFYDVSEVHAPHLIVAPFDRADSSKYIAAFADAYDVRLNPADLLDELERHGFGDFASHPLMLAMICILKSGPVPRLPRNSIGVIRRAIDTLTLRWDESKKIHRATELPLDGEDRVRCLMTVAFAMRELVADELTVRRGAEEYLRLAQWRNVNAAVLLDEIAQWYGILIPAGGGQWSFVHRTIHDFLAARFWVESGRFVPEQVTDFDARAAYAASLTPDATVFLTRALEHAREIHAFVECLNNNAPFDAHAVAASVVTHFDRFPDTVTVRQMRDAVRLSTEQDFFEAASDDLLDAMTIAGATGGSRAHDVVLAYALAELRRRNRPIALTVVREWAKGFRTGIVLYEVMRGDRCVRVALN